MYLFEALFFQNNFLTAHQPIPCLSLNLVSFANLSKFQSVQKDLLLFCLFPPYIFFVFWPLDQTKQQYHWQMRKKLRCYPPSLRCMKSARNRVEKAIKATGAKCTLFTYFVGDSKERVLRWDCTASLMGRILYQSLSLH